MANHALFELNPEDRTKAIWSEEDDKVYIQTRQDVEPIIRAAHERADWVPDKDFRHVAYMPMEIWQQACREGWVNDQARVRRWLNDPANQCFRTWPGAL